MVAQTLSNSFRTGFVELLRIVGPDVLRNAGYVNLWHRNLARKAGGESSLGERKPRRKSERPFLAETGHPSADFSISEKG